MHAAWRARSNPVRTTCKQADTASLATRALCRCRKFHKVQRLPVRDEQKRARAGATQPLRLLSTADHRDSSSCATSLLRPPGGAQQVAELGFPRVGAVSQRREGGRGDDQFHDVQGRSAATVRVCTPLCCRWCCGAGSARCPQALAHAHSQEESEFVISARPWFAAH